MGLSLGSLPQDTLPSSSSVESEMADYRDTIGALIVGDMLGTFVLGITWSAAYSYFRGIGKNDPWPFRLLVAYCVIGTTCANSITASWVFEWAAENFNRPEILEVLPWQLKAIPVMTGCVSCPVQLFFCWRIYKLSTIGGTRRRRIRLAIPGTIAVAVLVVWAAVVWIALRFHPVGQMKDINVAFPVAWCYFLGASAIDLAITISLVYFLIFKTRDYQSGHQAFVPTRNRLKQIVTRSVQLNTISLIFQSAIPALLLTPSGLWFAIFSFSLEAVYTLSLIASLNNRHRDQGRHPALGSPTSSDSSKPQRRSTAPGIHVTRAITVDIESPHPAFEIPLQPRFERQPITVSLEEKQQEGLLDAPTLPPAITDSNKMDR